MNYNIIGFGGRLGSGKTELANICEQYGYEKLYFALPLKQLCADLLNVTIDELNVLKRNNTTIDVTITENWVDVIHKETHISFDNINDVIGGKVIHTVRELLQVIGTDVIRKYNFNWHVDRIKSMIEVGKKYVIDDVRFPNEKEMIEQMGGVCWYVIRPTMNNISNHISETSLNWKQFENVIVNNKSLKYLKYNWEVFMSKGHDYSLSIRRELYNKIVGNYHVVENISNITQNGEQYFNLKDALFIDEDEFLYTPKFSSNISIRKIEEKEEYVLVSYFDGTEEIVKNPFLIEDLKQYL